MSSQRQETKTNFRSHPRKLLTLSDKTKAQRCITFPNHSKTNRGKKENEHEDAVAKKWCWSHVRKNKLIKRHFPSLSNLPRPALLQGTEQGYTFPRIFRPTTVLMNRQKIATMRSTTVLEPSCQCQTQLVNLHTRRGQERRRKQLKSRRNSVTPYIHRTVWIDHLPGMELILRMRWTRLTEVWIHFLPERALRAWWQRIGLISTCVFRNQTNFLRSTRKTDSSLMTFPSRGNVIKYGWF